MEIRNFWHHLHPSSTMAMISPRLGTRRPALRISTSALGSSSSSHLSYAAATEHKKVFEDQLRGIVCYIDEKGEMTKAPGLICVCQRRPASHGLQEFRSLISSTLQRSRFSRTLKSSGSPAQE